MHENSSHLIVNSLRIMDTNWRKIQKELVKQVNWALRAREPIGFKAVSDVNAKWKPAGYDVRFDGGCAVIAHFEGRIVALAWQQMGNSATDLRAVAVLAVRR